MLSRVLSAAVTGIDAYAVEVEVNCGYGETFIVLVGLPDAAVKESKERVSTAMNSSGYKFPMGKSTINLAPADVKKEGPSFDLPIALGMLAASEQIETDMLNEFIAVGELALTGGIGPVGNLPPHHSHYPQAKFPSFQAVKVVSSQSKNAWRAPAEKAC